MFENLFLFVYHIVILKNYQPLKKICCFIYIFIHTEIFTQYLYLITLTQLIEFIDFAQRKINKYFKWSQKFIVI